HNPEIVHFYGLSSDDNKIMLYKDESKTVMVKPEDLANLFKLFNKSLRCVILSSCYNDKQAEAIAQHIDCVVGTLKSTEEKSSASFAQGFYRALGGGKNVNEAFEFGEVQMKLVDNKGKPKIIAIKVDPAELIFE
ncbi:MAG: CHAT domain-containing protein, partial [Asgard group archaeon]|nr:CHAT domain-containing protein [Asgard group archaeon]